jgi:hypothetical protein
LSYADELVSTNLVAEAAGKAKSVFLVMSLSHEIRTPQGRTRCYPIQLEYVQTAQASGSTLSSLISDVWEMSQKGHLRNLVYVVRDHIEN